MNQIENRARSFIAKTFLIFWIILNIAIFIIYPGRVSHIHQFVFNNLSDVLSSFKIIAPIKFVDDLVVSFSGVIVFSFVCIVAGRAILIWCSSLQEESLNSVLEVSAYVVTMFLFGELAISSFLLLLGSVYRVSSENVYIILTVVLIVGGISFLRKPPALKQKKNFKPAFDRLSRFYKIIFSLSIVIIFFSLFYSSSRLSYDATSMYFSNSKLTSMTDRVHYFLSGSFLVSSLHVGIQYSAIIKLFGDQAARMYSWVGGVIVLILSVAIGEKLGLTKRANIMLLAMLISSTAFLDLMGDGKIDLHTMAPSLAAIYWMINSRGYHKITYIITGLLAGFSIISRPFNAFLLFIIIGLYYGWKAYLQKGKSKEFLNIFVVPMLYIGLGVIILIAFHFLESWILLGNPITSLTDATSLDTNSWQWSFNPSDLLIFRFFYPVVVTFINSPQSLGNLTPLFTAFLPIVLSRKNRLNTNLSKELVIVGSISLLTVLLWINLFFTVVEIRYVFPLWIILFMPLAIFIVGVLERADYVLKRIMQISIIVLMSFVAVRVVIISLSTYSPIDKAGAPHCYDSFLCDYLRPLNNVAIEGDRVLVLSAYRYYLRPDLFACSSQAEEYRILQNSIKQDPLDFWAEVYRQDYQYIAYEKNYSYRHLNIDFISLLKNIPEWISLIPISSDYNGDQIVYKITTNKPPVSREKSCNKDIFGIWDIIRVEQ